MIRKYNNIIYVLIVTVVLSLVGCSSVPIKLNQVPSKTVDYSKGREINGKACGFQLLLIIPISINDRQHRAYTQIAAAAGGDYVSDIEIEDSWFYGLVGTGYCTEIKAKAYPYKSN
jgi:hypothetical protein